jgi:Helix-turn-helix domain
MTFKIGDRVKINTNYPETRFQGDTGVVSANDWDPFVEVEMDPGNPEWATYDYSGLFFAKELDHAPKPSLATAVGLEPQTRRILNHLEKRGSISAMEAIAAYGCTRLAAQVFKLRKAGFDVLTDLREDEAGHRYARYSLPKAA